MKVRMAVLGMLAAIVFAATGPADATLLTNANTAELAGIVITVTIGSEPNAVGSCTNASGCTTLAVQLTTKPVTNTALGIDKFAYNLSSGTTPGILAVSETGWNFPAPGGTQMDGFGSFSDKAAKPAGTGGITSPLVFTLNGIASFVSTAPTFAVHIRFDSCSGFVSDGTASGGTDSDTTTGCTRTPVPEPVTMFLGGTGLLLLAYAARKRLFGGERATAA